ncbi:MoaD/ThiS family protein [Microbacterium flavum]|uniref:MoaD/ThiS family protein n=1 Tax=Microbacterium flavum TaxID=415216 RepID=A0ABS5XXY4_9MICO|nr:MoaD/ThiS family protein [Microbacterium flavum]MBT8798757.1 MoaD/ThiS family protein [Microbacterium flavum]
MRVRLFAGAADAAGTEDEHLDPAPRSAGALRTVLAERFGAEFADVLSRCALLVDGKRAEDDATIPASATVDVLPPFAGG